MKRALGLLALALVLAGCSPGTPTPTSTVTITTIQTLTSTQPTPTPVQTGPIAAGPTTSASGTCPFLTAAAAADALGIRLGRQTRQTAGGKAIGCQFFATTDPTFVASEHLPGPNQPVMTLRSSTYASAVIAHNAMVAIGTAGANAHTVTLTGGVVGVAYQTRFDPTDGSHDWAYVFSRASTVVTVLTAQSDSELDAQVVAGQIAPLF